MTEILVPIGLTNSFVDIGENSDTYGWVVYRRSNGYTVKVQRATALAVSLAKSKHVYETMRAKDHEYA